MKRKYPVSITKVAKELGMHTSAIYNRMRTGWSYEEAITKPKAVKKIREVSDKEVWGGCKKYKSFDESCIRGKKIFCDKDPEKTQDFTNYTNVGGWRIIYLNHVKKGEYRFQAYNTDGRSYKTNDSIEIQCALEKIFTNVCK